METEIPGLYYFENIISPEIAEEIVSFLEENEWESVSRSDNGRKVQQYGYAYNYTHNTSDNLAKIEPIPDILMPLQKIGLEHLTAIFNLDVLNTCKLNQCIVNKYLPKQGISKHIDKEYFGPAIVCFSLGSTVPILFTRTKDGQPIQYEHIVKPNSLYIMTGESRYEWKHEIKPRLADNGTLRGTRISITFRTIYKVA